MTDIFIKSYNRAFYLDRCIASIYMMVKGTYRIIILDDGTPAPYLNKLQERYPKIEIRHSKQYNQKAQGVEENIRSGKPIDSLGIPTDLWIDAVKNASEYFIITEDDVWFTQPINVDELSQTTRRNNISLLKLGWLNNYKDDQWLNLSPIDKQLTAVQPKDLFLSSPIIMDWFFYNKYKFFTIGYKLKLFDNYTKLKYWALNSILMGFWQKDYWLYIWKDAYGKVDEKQQLRNAAIYYRNHKNNPNFIARLKDEALQTTFQSSATNSYHEYGFDFDVNLFNHLINEAWSKGDFDAMQNFPKDFSLDYFTPFIDGKIKIEEYRKWVEQFKNQYRNLGCNVE